ncbi:TBC1 domain family member 13 [Exaiptasia diaphana]|uniref:TBC1 domain family member 13 n=1 Tax=Exaiptasia diaphana TaxID=2652724 RepID=A0A913Y9I4_EXADI|nr:TBC1 domain family member 13 [Exaiptasia diaphana]KXJ21818.1 TBC1 domain family member 13 [Exaiptasia diaphana]
MAYKQRVAEFQTVLNAQVINIRRLRMLCFNGIPDDSGIRALCWKLMLGYLPLERESWSKFLGTQRSTYKQFVHEIIVEQSRGVKSGAHGSETHVDHPLNPNPDSGWVGYFKDNETLLQIDKDCRRLLPDISFFQMATRYPNEEMMGDDIDFETLQKRVQNQHLEASHVNTSRVGITNVSTKLKKVATEEYSVLEEGQEAHWEVVERILFIYAKLNPGISYVQGMNEILGPLYYIFASHSNPEWQAHAEADSFFCFTNLMSEIRDNFIKSLDESATGIGNMMKRVLNLLREKDLELYISLEKQQMKPQFYTFRWLTLMLSQEFDLPDVIRVWDSLFADEKRFEFLIFVCCAMHIVIRDQLLVGDFVQSMKLLQNYPETDIQKILSKAIELKKPPIVVPKQERHQKTRFTLKKK